MKTLQKELVTGLSLQVFPNALASRVMIWRRLFAASLATYTPESQSLKSQVSQQATASLKSFSV